MPVYPVFCVAGRIGEALELAHGFSEHGGVVLFADDPVSKLIPFEQRRGQTVIPKASTSAPIDGFRDSACIVSIHNLCHPGKYVRMAVISQFDHDPSAVHFVCDCSCCPRPCKGIENPIARICRNRDHSLHKAFWFGSREWNHVGKEGLNLPLCLLRVAYFSMRPPTSWDQSALNFFEVKLYSWIVVAVRAESDASILN